MKWRALRKTLLVAIAVFILGLVAPAGAESRERKLPPNSTWIDSENDLLLVPVFIFDHWRAFLLDTGADYTVLSTFFTNHLTHVSDARINAVETVSKPIPFFEGVPIHVGGHWFYPRYVAATDMAPLEELTGDTFDGVVGINALTNYAVTFDFPAQTLSLETNLPAPMRAGLPFRSVPTGRFTFQAMLENGETIELGVDTGFRGYISLIASDWAKAFPKGARTKKEKRVDFEGRVFETEEARLPMIKIGSETYTNLFCDRISNTNLGWSSFIGLSWLEKHRVTLNYPDQLIQFRRIKVTGPPEDEMTGMAYRWIRGSMMIFDVDAGSPAEKAGLRAGDEILRINGTRIWQLKRREIVELLDSHEGDTVSVFVMRGDETLTVRMTLKPQL